MDTNVIFCYNNHSERRKVITNTKLKVRMLARQLQELQHIIVKTLLLLESDILKLVSLNLILQNLRHLF